MNSDLDSDAADSDSGEDGLGGGACDEGWMKGKTEKRGMSVDKESSDEEDSPQSTGKSVTSILVAP